MNKSEQVYIGLGSNIGNKQENIKKTIELIEEKYQIISASSLFISEPWGFNSDEKFVNSVICIKTNDEPIEIFTFLKTIESRLGRVKTKKEGYEDRIIDLDILFYGDKILKTKEVTIPHKEIQNRRFVLEPMNEIDPEFIHPTFKQKIKSLLQDCPDTSICKK